MSNPLSPSAGVMLTYATPDQVTVHSTATTLVSSGSGSGFRRVTLWLRSGADTGIYINPNGTATSTHPLIQAGGSATYDTHQAITAIRAGSADVVVNVQVGTGT